MKLSDDERFLRVSAQELHQKNKELEATKIVKKAFHQTAVKDLDPDFHIPFWQNILALFLPDTYVLDIDGESNEICIRCYSACPVDEIRSYLPKIEAVVEDASSYYQLPVVLYLHPEPLVIGSHERDTLPIKHPILED